MPFSLFDLARRLEQGAKVRHTKRHLRDVQTDPHLARDIGVPYRPREPARTEEW